MTSSTVIRTTDLRKTYQSGVLRKQKLEALRGVSLDVQPGEVFGLLGPNGAGKTTLIKILLGIVRRSSGQAKLLGHEAGSQNSRREVGYLPENLRIAKHHTARSALKYYGRLNRVDSSTINARSEELLDLVGLRGRDKESVKRFSKGMGQRLGLAQALLHDPKLLILDEPTDGLDPVGRSQVRDVIDELKQQGKSIFLNSHILQEVEMICDRVAILAKGEVKAVGDINTLRSQFEEKKLLIDVISSDREALSQAIPSAEVTLLSGEDVFRLTLEYTNQNDVDAVVDQIRQHGISITSIQQSQASLEEVFLSLVGSQQHRDS